VADGILDPQVHNAHRIEMRDDSMRHGVADGEKFTTPKRGHSRHTSRVRLPQRVREGCKPD